MFLCYSSMHEQVSTTVVHSQLGLGRVSSSSNSTWDTTDRHTDASSRWWPLQDIPSCEERYQHFLL